MLVARVGYSVAGRSRGRVALCSVCTVHVETRSTGFLVENQNQGRWFVSDLASKPMVGFLTEHQNQGGGGFFGLGLKTGSNGLVIWASKSPQRFGGLGLKITMTVSWFGPQNRARFGLSVVPQSQWREVSTGHASRSSGLLHVEASLARVSWFA